jgi:hypothetical protein
MLPEIGGRIFLGQDKVNNDYDFCSRQDVIKPALVGLAGPWISGGVEFNWPQHHRPGTYMPADLHIEEEATLEGEHNTVRYSELFEPKLLKILALGIFIAVFVKKRNAAILCTRSLACRHRPNGR